MNYNMDIPVKKIKRAIMRSTSSGITAHSHSNKALLDSISQATFDQLDDHETRLTVLESGDSVSVVTTTLNISILPGITLVDATIGDRVITLPNPSIAFVSGKSFSFAISKIDDTENIVTIQSFNNELILGYTNITLKSQNDIVNLITNGTNWYLGA